MPRKAKDTERKQTSAAPSPETSEKTKDASKAKPRRRAKRKVAASQWSVRKPSKRKRMATRRSRRGVRYSDAERRKILATAKREGLTGAQVRDHFGISTLTYYTWRKKAGSRARRGRPPGSQARRSGDGVAGMIRDQVRAAVRQLIPDIVRSEVSSALSVGSSRARR